MIPSVPISSEVVLHTLESKLLMFSQDFPAPVYHRFGPGLYIREMHIPAGVVGMGHKQKCVHMNNFVKGKIRLLTDSGFGEELVAPMTFVGQPGRKVVYVIEDMIWQNIYATDETDIEILEDAYLEKSPESVEYYNGKGFSEKELNEIKADFLNVVAESGLTEEYITSESEKTEFINLPYRYSSVCIRTSKIHGKGLFASAPIMEGKIVAPAVLNGKKTVASRYTNHSPDPNAIAVVIGNNVYFVANKFIQGCMSGDNGQEITIDYRESIKYRKEILCLDG